MLPRAEKLPEFLCLEIGEMLSLPRAGAGAEAPGAADIEM